MADVAAIILAAGESSRFGQAKQLVEFRGRSLVQRAIDAARDGGCRPVVVVTGNESDRIVAVVSARDVSIVENTGWREGVGSSIRLGMRHLIESMPQTSAVVLMACDQPFVTGKIVSAIIDQWGAAGKLIVASGYSGTLGVPALFDRSCFDELMQLDGDTGAKKIILRDRERISQFPFPDGESDIDTLEDYDVISSKGSPSL